MKEEKKFYLREADMFRAVAEFVRREYSEYLLRELSVKLRRRNGKYTATATTKEGVHS